MAEQGSAVDDALEGDSSAVECLLSMCETLGVILSSLRNAIDATHRYLWIGEQNILGLCLVAVPISVYFKTQNFPGLNLFRSK